MTMALTCMWSLNFVEVTVEIYEAALDFFLFPSDHLFSYVLIEHYLFFLSCRYSLLELLYSDYSALSENGKMSPANRM